MIVESIVLLGLPLWLCVEELMRLRRRTPRARRAVYRGRYGRRSATGIRTAGRASSVALPAVVMRSTDR